MLVAVVLAFLGQWIRLGKVPRTGEEILLPLVVGLLATPLAPVAKDISTALATAVNTMQLVKK
jgi:hypothetical protein